MAAPPSYACPYCGQVSYHPMDVEERYCGACHRWASNSGIRYQILDEAKRIVPASMRQWAEWLEKSDDWQIAETLTELYRVSTIFLGFDHAFPPGGPPVLFKTVVFEREGHEQPTIGGWMLIQETEQATYATYDDAMAGHQAAVRRFLKRERDAAARLKNSKQKEEK